MIYLPSFLFFFSPSARSSPHTLRVRSPLSLICDLGDWKDRFFFVSPPSFSFPRIVRFTFASSLPLRFFFFLFFSSLRRRSWDNRGMAFSSSSFFFPKLPPSFFGEIGDKRTGFSFFYLWCVTAATSDTLFLFFATIPPFLFGIATADCPSLFCGEAGTLFLFFLSDFFLIAASV